MALSEGAPCVGVRMPENAVLEDIAMAVVVVTAATVASVVNHC